MDIFRFVTPETLICKLLGIKARAAAATRLSLATAK